MKIYQQLIKKIKDQRGAVAVWVAIMVVFVIIGMMALAIDVGYFHSTKNELQNIADAAALAGAGKLGDIYINMTSAAQDTHNFEGDRSNIETSAKAVVGSGKNPAGGKDVIDILDEDIEIGTWNPDADPKFTLLNPIIVGGTLPDAVRVISRRDDSANNPVSTFFGRIFGQQTQNITADAVAALTTLAEVSPGEMKLPIGLSMRWFKPIRACGNLISFSPTDSCAGWHNFFDAINPDNMREKLLGFINGDPLSDDECLSEPCGDAWLDDKFGADDYPVVEPTGSVDTDNSFFEFQGGAVATLFNNQALIWEVPPTNPENGRTYGSKDFIKPSDVDLDDSQDIDGSGQIAVFNALFDYFRFRDGDGIDTNGDGHPDALDMDGDGIADGIDFDGDGTYEITHPDAVWSATVPVYKDDTWEESSHDQSNPSCINPNTSLKIEAFARVTVIKPNPPPDKTVQAIIDCNLIFIQGIGGGGMTGNVRASIPNLVE